MIIKGIQNGALLSVDGEDNTHIGVLRIGEDLEKRFMQMLLEHYDAEITIMGEEFEYYSYNDSFTCEIVTTDEDGDQYSQTLTAHLTWIY